MKTFKLFYFLFFVLTLNSSLFAQTTVEFSYDNAGNRTTIEVIYLDNISKSFTEDSSSNDTASRDNEPMSLVSDDDGKIIVKPNPTKGKLTVVFTGKFQNEKKSIIVTSQSGLLVHNSNTTDSEEEIDLSRYTDGIYFLKIELEDHTKSWKIIKEKF